MTLIKKWLRKDLQALEPIRSVAIIEAVCNLSCHHCYWAHDINEKSQSDWTAPARKIASFSVPVLYAGRILSRHGLAFLNACLEAGSTDFGIVDHGYTIFTAPEEWLRRFASINISIDGWKDAHDKQRNKEGAFDVAWNAVLRLKELGLDPIVATAFSHLTFEGWERFEALLHEHDIRHSTTLVLAASAPKARGTAIFRSKYSLQQAFEKLCSGIPRVINLYGLEHIEALAPLLAELHWEMDSFHGDSLVATLPNKTEIIYRPQSVQLIGELAIRWDGKFYPPTVHRDQSPIDLDNVPSSYIEYVQELNTKERDIWSSITTIDERR